MNDTTPSQTHSQDASKASPQATSGEPAVTQTLDPSLLDLLICPLTRSHLELQGQELVAQVGGLRYPVRQGVPIMLVSEATLPAGVASLEEFKAKYAAGS